MANLPPSNNDLNALEDEHAPEYAPNDPMIIHHAHAQPEGHANENVMDEEDPEEEPEEEGEPIPEQAPDAYAGFAP
ncbi:hypothetical protein Tco_1142057 [Tanacetum coccineum]